MNGNGYGKCRFVDTNVLLYAISTDPAEQRKADIAKNLLFEADDLALSVQVLQEFYVQATRPKAAGPALAHTDALAFVEEFLRFPVQEMTLSLLRLSLSARERYRISFWDAAIVEAARAMGCDVVLSEDLSHGQSYGGVRVVDPFHLETA